MVVALCTSGVGLKSVDEIEEHLLRPNLCTSPFVSFTSELIKLYQHFTCGFFVKKFPTQLICTYILGLYFFGARISEQKLLLEFC
jgi:hypothetical protein